MCDAMCSAVLLSVLKCVLPCALLCVLLSVLPFVLPFVLLCVLLCSLLCHARSAHCWLLSTTPSSLQNPLRGDMPPSLKPNARKDWLRRLVCIRLLPPALTSHVATRCAARFSRDRREASYKNAEAASSGPTMIQHIVVAATTRPWNSRKSAPAWDSKRAWQGWH